MCAQLLQHVSTVGPFSTTATFLDLVNSQKCKCLSYLITPILKQCIYIYIYIYIHKCLTGPSCFSSGEALMPTCRTKLTYLHIFGAQSKGTSQAVSLGFSYKYSKSSKEWQVSSIKAGGWAQAVSAQCSHAVHMHCFVCPPSLNLASVSCGLATSVVHLNSPGRDSKKRISRCDNVHTCAHWARVLTVHLGLWRTTCDPSPPCITMRPNDSYSTLACVFVIGLPHICFLKIW